MAQDLSSNATLDGAAAAFEVNPCERTATVYRYVAHEHFHDEMIGEATLADVLVRTTPFVKLVTAEIDWSSEVAAVRAHLDNPAPLGAAADAFAAPTPAPPDIAWESPPCAHVARTTRMKGGGRRG